MLLFSSLMLVGGGVELGEDLVVLLVRAGRLAHRVAGEHDLEAYSNAFTYGTDRYQRATQMLIGPLEQLGFVVWRRGAGLIARGERVELQFAVAKGNDLTDPACFDAGSSPARRRAAQRNSGQLQLPGMVTHVVVLPVVHVVWSGDRRHGLTAVHAGELLGGMMGERLRWRGLVRLDQPAAGTVPSGLSAEPAAVRAYSELPDPDVQLSVRRRAVLAGAR